MSKQDRHRSQVSQMVTETGETPPNSCDILVTPSGEVAIQFTEPTRHMTFTPEMARKLGQGFIEMAMKADMLLDKMRLTNASSKRTH